MKAKRDLEVLPPTHGALKFHITRENYQAKIGLPADHVIMDLENVYFVQIRDVGWWFLA